MGTLMNYPIVIYPDEQGGCVVEIPALKGCLAQGETLPEALDELETVKTVWLESAINRGQLLPDVDREVQKVKALSRN
jgi:antitoxin HicB